MTWPQPPYAGDAWEYAVFDTLPEGWTLVNPTADGVFAKRQAQQAESLPRQPAWTLCCALIDDQVIRRLQVWE